MSGYSMNMENWIKLVDVLSWPLTTLVIALTFKGELSKILTRISKIKYKEIEASFGKELTLIEEAIDKNTNLISENNKSLREKFTQVFERIFEIADISPRACISEAWREVEQATINLLKSNGDDPKNTQLSKRFREILTANNYPWSLYEDYKNLMALRNKAVHANDAEITKSESERFALASMELAMFIDKLRKELPNK